MARRLIACMVLWIASMAHGQTGPGGPSGSLSALGVCSLTPETGLEPGVTVVTGTGSESSSGCRNLIMRHQGSSWSAVVDCVSGSNCNGAIEFTVPADAPAGLHWVTFSPSNPPSSSQWWVVEVGGASGGDNPCNPVAEAVTPAHQSSFELQLPADVTLEWNQFAPIADGAGARFHIIDPDGVEGQVLLDDTGGTLDVTSIAPNLRKYGEYRIFMTSTCGTPTPDFPWGEDVHNMLGGDIVWNPDTSSQWTFTITEPATPGGSHGPFTCTGTVEIEEATHKLISVAVSAGSWSFGALNDDIYSSVPEFTICPTVPGNGYFRTEDGATVTFAIQDGTTAFGLIRYGTCFNSEPYGEWPFDTVNEFTDCDDPPPTGPFYEDQGDDVDTEWSREDIDALVAAAGGDADALEAIRSETEGLRGDLAADGTGSVGDGSFTGFDNTHENAIRGLAPGLEFEDGGPMSPFDIEFPMPGAQTHTLFVPIDPRGWDMGLPVYAGLDVLRGLFRALLAVFVILACAAATLKALRQY